MYHINLDSAVGENMNLLNINAKDLNILGNSNEKGKIDYSFLVNEGDILEGVVSDNNKVCINVNGKEIKVDNSSIGKDNIGDSKKYQVLNRSKDKLVLQEIKENNGVNKKIDINSKINSAEIKQDYFTQEIKKSISDAKSAIANNDMEQQLTEKLDKSVIVMSPEDLRALEEEGKSIEDMDIEEIHKKISKINREKVEKENTNCGIVDKNVDNLQSLQNTMTISQNNVDNSAQKGDIVRENKYQCGILIENTDFKQKFNNKINIDFISEDGEIIENNIDGESIGKESLEIVDKLFEDIKTSDKETVGDARNEGFVTKDAIKYLIINDLEPTLENIYKAKYAGKNIVTRNISDEDFEQLRSQVDEVITNAGYEVNDENIKVAKWLIENDIPITEDTLIKYNKLQDLNKYTVDDVNRIANEYIEENVPIKDMYINYVDDNVIEDTINNIGIITDEAIENTIKDSKTINLNELLASQREIDSSLYNETIKENKKSFGIFENKNHKGKYINLDRIMTNLDEMETRRAIDVQVVTARRQLEEVRLKLTLESGRKLALKGFNIATEELTNVVEELKNIERKYNDNYPEELKDNFEGQKLYDDTNSKVTDIKEMSGYVLSSTYSIKEKITLQGIYDEGSKADYLEFSNLDFKVSRRNTEKFNETFETIMTMPRKDMGDSINKAFRNIDDILDDLGLEVNELNQRAVRILGYNSMDITKENIEEVKLYDYQVNNAIDNLKPTTVVELIRQDKNPLNMTIEELNNEIDNINSQNTDKAEENYSKYLWRLDRQNGLTSDEREAFIGIYRLLNQVQKSDGAVIGATINAGQEVTLNNLLTASRTRKSKGVNVNVDNNMGMTETITREGKTIDAQINTAFTNTKIKLSRGLVRQVSETITPEIIDWAKEEKVDILNMSMEKLIGFIKSKEELNEKLDKEYYIDKLNAIKDIADKSSEVVKLLTSAGMETSINNILAAADTLNGNGVTGTIKKLNKKNNKDDVLKTDINRKTVAEIKSQISETVAGVMEHLDDKGALIDDYEEINNQVRSIVKAYSGHYGSSNMSIEELRAISRNMNFATNMSKKECYDIPLIISENEDGINVTNINLTVIRNTDKKQVVINIDSDQLGRIEAKFNYKNNAIKGLILGDNTQGIEALKNNYNSLKEKALEDDINIKQLDYGINNKINYTFTVNHNKIDETEVTTKKLYSLSKAMILNIKETEQQLLAKS